MQTPSEEVKNRLDVAEVVGGYMRLSQAGTNLKGLCPFHHEKTPSFYVSKEKQIWHCFGCGAGGDVFAFVMRMEGVEFPDALRSLADRAGVVLRAQDPRERSERARMAEILKATTLYYEERLAEEEAKDIRDYLARRGVSEETRQNFRLGYAPANTWDGLVRQLQYTGIRPDEMERAGLAVRNDRGGLRDRFHNRIMFPLLDSSTGNAIGFSGRFFDARHPAGSTASPPKYLNSPETLLFSKRSFLYGLNAAKGAIREKGRAVLVEGQFDLILSHQAGVREAVATSGTALTEDHIRLLKRHMGETAEIRAAFDSDAAGEATSERAWKMLLQHGITPRIIAVTSGKDPADVVQASPEQWRKNVDEAVHIVEYFLHDVAGRREPTSEDERGRMLDRILRLIGAVQNPVEQGTHISQILSSHAWNKGLGALSEKLLHERMQKLAVAEQTPAPKERAMAPAKPDLRDRWTDIEEFLVAFLITHRGIGKSFLERLSEDLFDAEHTRALYPIVYAYVASDEGAQTAGDAISNTPEQYKDALNLLMLKADRYIEQLKDFNPQVEMETFVRELSERRIRRRLRDLSGELKTAQGDLRKTILSEFSRLSERLHREAI